MKSETRYLNTDLHLEGPNDLTLLAKSLEKKGLIITHVRQWEADLWSARFATGRWFDLPDKCIARMLKSVETLNKASKLIWESCTVRDFDIGYDCGEEPRRLHHRLSATTLQRVAGVGGSVLITLYSAKSDDDIGSCSLIET